LEVFRLKSFKYLVPVLEHRGRPLVGQQYHKRAIVTIRKQTTNVQFITIYNLIINFKSDMVFLCRNVVTVIAVLASKLIVSYAQADIQTEPWTTDDEQCVLQNEILFNDTILNSLFPRNVSCQSSNDTYCAIDFDTVNGVDEYYSRCFELQGRIVFVNVINTDPAPCNVSYAEDHIAAFASDTFSLTNEPFCLGVNCTRDAIWPTSDLFDRLAELGILTCSLTSTDIFVNTGFSGLCAAETRTLRKALAGTYTELNCPTSDTPSSCVLDYGPTSNQYQSTCLEMGGQLFVIANKTTDCERAEVNGTNTFYSYSQLNEYYCFGASCTPNVVIEEDRVIQDSWIVRWSQFYYDYHYNRCTYTYDKLTAVDNATTANTTATNNTATNTTAVNNFKTLTTSDAERSWTFMAISILAVAVSFQ
jgi:hypothetical protein